MPVGVVGDDRLYLSAVKEVVYIRFKGLVKRYDIANVIACQICCIEVENNVTAVLFYFIYIYILNVVRAVKYVVELAAHFLVFLRASAACDVFVN